MNVLNFSSALSFSLSLCLSHALPVGEKKNGFIRVTAIDKV
jgi:hypothetical protein